MSTRYVRAPRQNQHVLITPVSTVRDETISYRDLGVLSRLLSTGDGFGQTAEELSTGAGREGRDAVRTALRRLTKAGYIQRDAAVGEDGRFIGWEMRVYDTPHPQKRNKNNRKPENPLADFPLAGKPVQKSSKSNNQQEKSSSTAGDARSKQERAAAALNRGKHYSRRSSGIECWQPGDAEAAERIEHDHDQPTIDGAVCSLAARGKPPVPGSVLSEIRRRQKERVRAARAGASTATTNPEADAAAFAALLAEIKQEQTP